MRRPDTFSVILRCSLVAVAIGCSCSDNECTEPHPCVPDPTLENIWPNADGCVWTYDYLLRTWDLPDFKAYDDIDSVPAAPTLDEVESLLHSHPIGDSPRSLAGIYRLKFDGQITTQSGVTAQNLTESLWTETSPGLTAGGTPTRKDIFLRRLVLARPDLRARIVHLLGSQAGEGLPLPGHLCGTQAGRDGYWQPASGDTFEIVPREPLLLHGYAWEKTTEWIGTYGDLDTLLAWKFLESDLTVGHEFVHQLVPAIADDVFLHCRILRRGSVTTEIGAFDKALECLYIVDYGIWNLTSIGGDPSQWSRSFDYGIVVYAPTVGPVYAYERALVGPDLEDEWNSGIGEVTVGLIHTTTP